MDLKTLQKEVTAWSIKNFGNYPIKGHLMLIGVMEELGELSHAHLKGAQGIRHPQDEILAMKKDAVGDIIIYLIDYCSSQNISIEECIDIAWKEVKTRTWNPSTKEVS